MSHAEPSAVTPEPLQGPAAGAIPIEAEVGGGLPPGHKPLHAAPAAVLHPKEDHGFVAVLGRSDFRYLWAAQVTSQLADKFVMYTVLLYVYGISKLALIPSLVMVSYTLPSVFLSAPAGVFADRHDKRHLMLICNVIRAFLVVLIPIGAHIPAIGNQIWLPIVVTLLFSSAGQVFAPAEAASIPSLVGREQITSATSLFITTVIVTLVVGVPMATLISAFYGTEVPFYIASGLFVIAAVSVWKIGTNLRPEPVGDGPRPQLLRELREGMAILGHSRALRLALLQLTVALVVVFTLFALGPAYMKTVLQRSPDDTYIVLIPATVGMIITAGILGQRGAGVARARLLVMALGGAGVTLAAFGAAPTLLRDAHIPGLLIWVTVALALLFGCALGALLIPAFTVLQERTTEESRGRIFGSIFTVINAAVAIPLLLAGGLADIFRVDVVLAGLGVILVGMALAARFGYYQRLSVLEEAPAAHLAAQR